MLAKLKIPFRDAETIHRSLKPDDMDWCYTYCKEGNLFIFVKTDKIGAMINALEDYFINLKALQNVINAIEDLNHEKSKGLSRL